MSGERIADAVVGIIAVVTLTTVFFITLRARKPGISMPSFLAPFFASTREH